MRHHLPLLLCLSVTTLSVHAVEEISEADRAMLEGIIKMGEAGTPIPKHPIPKDLLIKALQTPSPKPEFWEQAMPNDFTVDAEQALQDARDYLNNLPPPSKAELAALKQRTQRNLVHFSGGTFTMGDFGWWETPPWPITTEEEDDPPHSVTLSGFSIQTYRVTFADYDLFTRAKRLPAINTGDYFGGLRFRYPDYPAGSVAWPQARDYCLWLGDITGQPFDLPTEAQWEYAARSGGREVFFAAPPEAEKDVGKLNEILNKAAEGRSPDHFNSRPVGTYPPNRAGVYDMAGYGLEWVFDWYAPYGKASQIDPKGPDSGTLKVLRYVSSDPSKGVTSRRGEAATLKIHRKSLDLEYELIASTVNLNFRCALNKPKPWK
ncbi:formylglycine-generating enzyme family protein [Chitiniphilus eburneus]|nr:SUMF1/EgtB/PvdO family nonheme iron enzyme [Chitiniphilus eburneus]